MDSDTEKLCLEEIDHLVLDAGKKVPNQINDSFPSCIVYEFNACDSTRWTFG